MTIDKAIEILSYSANRGTTTFNQDYKDAQKLGIEALIRIRYQRQKPTVPHRTPLPGE